MNLLPPPLHGVRVLQVGRDWAASHCAMLLSELGADVVLLRLPNASEPPHHSGLSKDYSLMVDGGKRSIACSENWRDVAFSLARRADVVLESVAVEHAATVLE